MENTSEFSGKQTRKSEKRANAVTVTGASWVPTPNPQFNFSFLSYVSFLSLLTSFSVAPSFRTDSLICVFGLSLLFLLSRVRFFPFHMTVGFVLLLFVYILIIS